MRPHFLRCVPANINVDRRTVFAALLAATVLAFPARSIAANGDCGIPVTNGDGPLASDALRILAAAHPRSVGKATS